MTANAELLKSNGIGSFVLVWILLLLEHSKLDYYSINIPSPNLCVVIVPSQRFIQQQIGYLNLDIHSCHDF